MRVDPGAPAVPSGTGGRMPSEPEVGADSFRARERRPMPARSTLRPTTRTASSPRSRPISGISGISGIAATARTPARDREPSPDSGGRGSR